MQETPFVLVVDDERTITRLIVDVLNAKGYFAVGAHNLEHAVMHARARRPDVVLMDARLRGTSGAHVLDALREDHPELRAILMSGLSRETIESLAGASDCVAILPKPFALDALLSCIGRWAGAQAS